VAADFLVIVAFGTKIRYSQFLVTVLLIIQSAAKVIEKIWKYEEQAVIQKYSRLTLLV